MSANPVGPPLWGARYPRVHREEPASSNAPASPPLPMDGHSSNAKPSSKTASQTTICKMS